MSKEIRLTKNEIVNYPGKYFNLIDALLCKKGAEAIKPTCGKVEIGDIKEGFICEITKCTATGDLIYKEKKEH